MPVSVAHSRIGDLLTDSELPASDARALLAHLLGVTRERLVARPEQTVALAQVQEFFSLVEQRRRGQPLAYLLGEKEFYGRLFAVSPAVLIPRPETELLVELALELGPRAGNVLELGTGSGCIAISIALERDAWRVLATDVSSDALDVARANVARWHANVELRSGSWFDALSSEEQFDLIVSNPPYVAAGDPHLDALRFEPKLALVSGDGLSTLRSIIDLAPRYLVPGAHLALEHGSTQAEAVRELFDRADWHDVQTYADLARLQRVTSARRGAV